MFHGLIYSKYNPHVTNVVNKDFFFFFFFFWVKGNIHRQQNYPTPEVRPLQAVLTILTLQIPTKSELIKHKISALGR